MEILVSWNVSNVTTMADIFSHSKFTGDISDWNVSNVTTMAGMFSYSKFNGDISRWDFRRLENIYGMFEHSRFRGDESKIIEAVKKNNPAPKEEEELAEFQL